MNSYMWSFVIVASGSILISSYQCARREITINLLVLLLVIALSILAGGGVLYILEMQDVLDKLIVK